MTSDGLKSAPEINDNIKYSIQEYQDATVQKAKDVNGTSTVDKISIKNMSSFHFLSLPTELQMQIARESSNNEIIALCQTCKVLNARYRELLYKEVDLSFSHYGDYNLRRNQALFIQKLDAEPQRAKYIRSLKWKFTTAPYVFISENSSNRLFRDEFIFKELRANFELFTNVTSITLHMPYPRCLKAVPEDKPLFPKATSISLGGYLFKSLAKSILSGSAHRLMHLKWTDLKLVDEEFYPSSLDFDRKSLDSFLEFVIATCTGLESLDIRDNYCDLWRAVPRYKSYVKFLGSRSQTIEKFHLRGRHSCPYRTEMLDNFRLILKNARWPCLRRVKVLDKKFSLQNQSHLRRSSDDIIKQLTR